MKLQCIGRRPTTGGGFFVCGQVTPLAVARRQVAAEGLAAIHEVVAAAVAAIVANVA